MDLPLEHVWLTAPKPAKQLMVVLHGLGDSAEGFLWIQEAFAMDSLDYLLLNAPGRYYTGFKWYDLPPDQDPGISGSRSVLTALFRKLESDYAPDRTFLLGFSQ